MSKRSVEFKAVMPLEQLKGCLRDLLAGLDEGTVCVQTGTDFVALSPRDMVKVEIKAKEKKDKQKFSLELSWGGEMESKGDASALTISSDIPEPSAGEPGEEDEEAGGEIEAAEQAETDDGQAEKENVDDPAEKLRHGE